MQRRPSSRSISSKRPSGTSSVASLDSGEWMQACDLLQTTPNSDTTQGRQLPGDHRRRSDNSRSDSSGRSHGSGPRQGDQDNSPRHHDDQMGGERQDGQRLQDSARASPSLPSSSSSSESGSSSSAVSGLDVLASQAQARVGETRRHFSSSGGDAAGGFQRSNSGSSDASGGGAAKRERRLPPQPVITGRSSSSNASGHHAAHNNFRRPHPCFPLSTLPSEASVSAAAAAPPNGGLSSSDEPLSPSLMAAAWALSADTLSPQKLESVVRGVPAESLNSSAYGDLAEQLIGTMGAQPALSLTLALLGRSFAYPLSANLSSSSSSNDPATASAPQEPGTPLSPFSAGLGLSSQSLWMSEPLSSSLPGYPPNPSALPPTAHLGRRPEQLSPSSQLRQLDRLTVEASSPRSAAQGGWDNGASTADGGEGAGDVAPIHHEERGGSYNSL